MSWKSLLLLLLSVSMVNGMLFITAVCFFDVLCAGLKASICPEGTVAFWLRDMLDLGGRLRGR